MEPESKWKAEVDWERLQREKTLKAVPTREITAADDVRRAPTAVIRQTVMSPEEAIDEMKTWLRTGVAPDGTRMMTEESWQWHQDYYQATIRADPGDEVLPQGSQVDYYYWTAPYLAHIGPMDLVMMHAQVNVEDGTHLPADRLRAETTFMKNLRLKAEKRAEVQQRLKEEFVREALARRQRLQLKRVEEQGQPLFTLPTQAVLLS